LLGHQIQYLDLRKNILLGSITRNKEVIIPRGTDVLQEGDSVVVVTTTERLSRLDDILK
jgi:trk system potassium uptake protein TrkA